MPQRLLPSRLTPFLVMLLALFVLMIQGCGGGGGNSGTSNTDPSGYYIDTGFVEVKEADNMTQRRVTGIQGMVHGGQLMMLSDTENLTYVGTFTVSGNDFSGSVTLYEDGVATQENIPLSGLITATSKITGELGGTGAANGTFQLDYAGAMDNEPVNLAMVVRDLDWRPVVNLNIPNLNLANATDAASTNNFSTGGTGSNIFSGCTYSGRIGPVAGTHLYTVSVIMDSCDGGAEEVDGSPVYTGLASIRGTDRFILTLTNGIYDFSGEYKECLIIGCTP